MAYLELPGSPWSSSVRIVVDTFVDFTVSGFVRFSPDGRFLAACGSREQVAIWDLPDLRHELATLRLDWSD